MEGEDSAGADSGRLRGGTGGGTGTSSEARLKLTMEETEEDPESYQTDTVRTRRTNRRTIQQQIGLLLVNFTL